MKTKLLITLSLLLIALLIVGCAVYFIGLLQIPVAPTWLLMLALVYIMLQLARVRLFNAQAKKTDLLYYVGLIMIALPAFFEHPEQVLPYRWILVFFISSMIIPALQDVINQQKEQRT